MEEKRQSIARLQREKNTTMAHKNVFTFKTVCLFSMERITSTRIQLLCIRPVECNIYIVTLGVRTSIALQQRFPYRLTTNESTKARRLIKDALLPKHGVISYDAT